MSGVLELSIRGLRVAFDRWGQTVLALDGLDLTVPQGQWVMVVGHNGSGKSSLLRAIAGQVDVSGGAIIRSAGSPQDRGFASDCFFVTQDPLAGTADALSLLENLVVADPQLQRPKGAATSRRAFHEALMSSVGLLARQHQLLRYFSGGERQQIALLIAQLRNPSLLLLDEPFSALDPSRAVSCLGLVQAIHRQRTTILQVTHDEGLAWSIGDRTICLERGRLLSDVSGSKRCATGTPDIKRNLPV